MSVMLFVLAQSAVAPPPPSAPPAPVVIISPPPRPIATPIGNPASWITNDDYPVDALRGNTDGRVSFRLAVSANGVPTACTIVSTSGSASLDETTCRLVSERARFAPARDEKGAAVAGTYVNTVRWVIPEQPARPFRIIVTATVTPEGKLADCSAETGTALPPGMKAGPVPCPPRLRYSPFRNAAGEAVEGRIRLITELQVIEPVPATRQP